jgi:hypothetical protein
VISSAVARFGPQRRQWWAFISRVRRASGDHDLRAAITRTVRRSGLFHERSGTDTYFDMSTYKKERVDIVRIGTSPATWAFARRPVKGTEYRYAVTDRNLSSRSRWEFVVRVPTDSQGRIEVRPVRTPNDKLLAGLDRRSITFMRGTKPAYKGFRYCPLALADSNGEASRLLVRQDQKSRLPVWLQNVGRLRQKKDVRTTRGTDGGSVVMLVRPDDHPLMITAFLACKAWVLKHGFALN